MAGVVELQLSVDDIGSEIAKLIAPVGATAPVVPVTVAVKSSDPPRIGVEVVLIATPGVTGATAIDPAEEVTVL